MSTPHPYQTILYEELGPVARLTLNQPERRNPIGLQTAAELCQALAAISSNDAIAVVVVTGAGTVFSAGGDLSAMAAQRGGPIFTGLPAVLAAMHELGKPIVAMVNGAALAGGLGLMVACDLVISADTASFGTTEIALGLWPMMITAELTRSVGRKRVLEMMLTGRRLSAAEALSSGLVTQVVPAAELEAATLTLTTKLAARSPAAMRLGLRAFYECQDLAYAEQLQLLEERLGHVLALDDAAEGVAAFLGKRTPVWKGR